MNIIKSIGITLIFCSLELFSMENATSSTQQNITWQTTIHGTTIIHFADGSKEYRFIGHPKVDYYYDEPTDSICCFRAKRSLANQPCQKMVVIKVPSAIKKAKAIEKTTFKRTRSKSVEERNSRDSTSSDSCPSSISETESFSELLKNYGQMVTVANKKRFRSHIDTYIQSPKAISSDEALAHITALSFETNPANPDKKYFGGYESTEYQKLMRAIEEMYQSKQS